MRTKRLLPLFLVVSILASMLFFTTSIFANDSTSTLVNLSVSADNVEIQSNGYSEFVNAIATFSDNSTKNVNIDAIWRTNNQNVRYSL